MAQKYIALSFYVLITTMMTGCNKDVSPTAPGNSSGQLSRYDLIAADYDVQPVTAFTASYNSEGKMVNLFEKIGQSLFSYNLQYEADKLVGSLANDKGTQKITYNNDGKPVRVDYTTLIDTGKLVYDYDAQGKLIGVLDSLKSPLRLPVRYQYLFTYDAGGHNVVQITKNQLDLQGRPTLKQYSFYRFDDKPNPFTVFPYLQRSILLPGEVPALVNRNNITSARLVGTILNPSSGGSVPTLDTIAIYTTSRTYEYTGNGLPSKAMESFNNLQFNYSGNRTFKYEY